MCGRYASTRSAQQISDYFDALYDPIFLRERLADPKDPAPEGRKSAAEDIEPNYNVAPTDEIYIVRESHRDGQTRRVVGTARWGLVPSWADDPKVGGRWFNARAESVTDKPAFRRAFVTRRCLVPADGWFEWAKPGSPMAPGDRKQPYFMTSAHPLALAGLWEVWHGPDDALLITATVLTVPASHRFEDIHDRMPLVLAPAEWARWLGEDKAAKDDDVTAMLEARIADPTPPAVEDMIEIRPVGSAVGDVRNNGPELVAPLDLALEEAAEKAQKLF